MARPSAFKLPIRLGNRTVGHLTFQGDELRAALVAQLGSTPLDLGFTYGKLPLYRVSVSPKPVARALLRTEPDWKPHLLAPETIADALAAPLLGTVAPKNRQAVTSHVSGLFAQGLECYVNDWLAGRQIRRKDDLLDYFEQHDGDALNTLQLPVVRRALAEYWSQCNDEERRAILGRLLPRRPTAGAKQQPERDPFAPTRFCRLLVPQLWAARRAQRKVEAPVKLLKRQLKAHFNRESAGAVAERLDDARLEAEDQARRRVDVLVSAHFNQKSRQIQAGARKVLETFFAGHGTPAQTAAKLVTLRYGISPTRLRALLKN